MHTHIDGQIERLMYMYIYIWIDDLIRGSTDYAWTGGWMDGWMDSSQRCDQCAHTCLVLGKVHIRGLEISTSAALSCCKMVAGDLLLLKMHLFFKRIAFVIHCSF